MRNCDCPIQIRSVRFEVASYEEGFYLAMHRTSLSQRCNEKAHSSYRPGTLADRLVRSWVVLFPPPSPHQSRCPRHCPLQVQELHVVRTHLLNIMRVLLNAKVLILDPGLVFCGNVQSSCRCVVALCDDGVKSQPNGSERQFLEVHDAILLSYSTSPDGLQRNCPFLCGHSSLI